METQHGKQIHIGIDIGSVSVDCLILNNEYHIVQDAYVRHRGKPVETTLQLIHDIVDQFGEDAISRLAFTGEGGKDVAKAMDAVCVNEIVAQTRATAFLHPEVRTIIEIGGADSKLILLHEDPATGQTVLEDFAMNSVCAAGTGSFLDQQASRLGISIEQEFGEMALRSEHPPRVAGRCSVFAKSDMIHLQQIATPDYDIVAGLCYAMARNYKSNIGKGKNFITPIAFHGGVAWNKGVVKAFEDILDLQEGELIIPTYSACMGALGAILEVMEKELPSAFAGLQRLQDYVDHRSVHATRLARLSFEGDPATRHFIGMGAYTPVTHEGQRVPAYMGVDVGSISTNVVVIDQEGNVLSKRYLMTAGRPIEAVRQGIEEVGQEIADHVDIMGVGTTGSGRYLTGDFVGADIVRNEITAQAQAAVFIDPEVDTIFEIGGQDSKYISIDNSVVIDFEMNHACAAGTGSFLEEQAEKLGINIKEEFGQLALHAESPIGLGERCTVFMESDLLYHQQQGAKTDELVAGLSYSIVRNYLNRVVGDRRVGNKIFFQGGVAANKGVIAAFENVVGKPITVPNHHEVTGAIGVALLARDYQHQRGNPASRFRGFDLSKQKYEIKTFECPHCSNLCEIREVLIEGAEPLYYGGRCPRWDVNKEEKTRNRENIPDLFQEREKLLTGFYKPEKLPERGPTIGIPRTLFYHELFPFWHAFLAELGFKVVLSPRTNKTIIHKGVEGTIAESCFPIKVAHGQVLTLLERDDLDYIFLPSIIGMEQEDPDFQNHYLCPYVQTIPYLVNTAFEIEKGKFLRPVVDFSRGRKLLLDSLTAFGKQFGKTAEDVEHSLEIAERTQKAFRSTLLKRGQEILESLSDQQRALIIISRVYNGCDPGINLGLPQILRDLGVLAIPMDFLPIHDVEVADDWTNMYWKYGQRILKATKFIRNHPTLHALYITNFNCGPDSFLTTYFKKMMGDKPSLIIEIDEHSAPAGAITRCEAFLDSLENVSDRQYQTYTRTFKKTRASLAGRTLYIPYMGDHSYVFAAGMRGLGIPAEVFGFSDEESVEYGRQYTTGKECYPLTVTTGDMIKKIHEPGFDPQKSAFFMPSGTGPCRFGQYNMFQHLVMQELGYDIPILSPNQDDNFYKELSEVGKNPSKMGWIAMVGTDLLYKALFDTRPYEVNPGETNQVYTQSLQRLSDALEFGGNPYKAMEASAAAFRAIKVDKSRKKPTIGIVGEIYVRSHSFCNESVVEKVEALGGTTWLAPLMEWIYYTNYTRIRHAKVQKHYWRLLQNTVQNKIQVCLEHRLAKPFHGIIDYLEETDTEGVLGYADTYVDRSFEGETVLSIGKSIDYYHQGLSGIINAMPFGCMPGTIVTAILKKIREEYDNIPVLSIAYDGTQHSGTDTRLEAFMHQAKQYMHLQKNTR
ncbi:CoA activase [candidate division KSB3 bacterium]|uniref:CoA activase n=1 Tax=candidate division KSB3 bacterium TaxID=2044937 RepID=A0A9D5JSY9_9BACT|nr:CoA activase [candidate division KSB3 bacterium]MBD3323672.1 CoA activase [candidate division KSB3 bacterium]